MVKTNSAFGFTLVELLVVISLIGIMTAMVLGGLGQFRNSQSLANAQAEFLVQLRAVQNQVINGSDEIAVKSLVVVPNSSSYTIVNSYLTNPISKISVELPTGVMVAVVEPTGITASSGVCFSNPALVSFDATRKCVSSVDASSACVSGAGMLCTGTNVNSAARVTVRFYLGSMSKDVVLEGSGMMINRIYAK